MDKDGVIYYNIYLFCHRKHVDSILLCLFSNKSQEMSKYGKNISDTLSYVLCATYLHLPRFDVICDLLVNRRTATWEIQLIFIWSQVLDGQILKSLIKKFHCLSAERINWVLAVYCLILPLGLQIVHDRNRKVYLLCFLLFSWP